MKATSSDMYRIGLFGISLLVLGMCVAACDRDMEVHPDARAAMNSLGDTNLTNLWASVAAFADAVRTEDRLIRLAIDDPDVFAILAGQVIDARLADGILASTRVAQPLSQADAEHILAWIAKCKTYGVCGYDLRSLPEYYRVFIRNDVCFVILGDKASLRYRDQFAFQAKRGVTPRGDAFGEVTNGIFVATERR